MDQRNGPRGLRVEGGRVRECVNWRITGKLFGRLVLRYKTSDHGWWLNKRKVEQKKFPIIPFRSDVFLICEGKTLDKERGGEGWRGSPDLGFWSPKKFVTLPGKWTDDWSLQRGFKKRFKRKREVSLWSKGVPGSCVSGSGSHRVDGEWSRHLTGRFRTSRPRSSWTFPSPRNLMESKDYRADDGDVCTGPEELESDGRGGIGSCTRNGRTETGRDVVQTETWESPRTGRMWVHRKCRSHRSSGESTDVRTHPTFPGAVEEDG